jgi:uncharacterized protein (DUF983 family)
LPTVDSFPEPSFGRAMARGAVAHCPRCGSGGVFRHWVSMVDDCPGCGLHFERTEGYWLGAMLINLAVTMGAFLVVFLGVMIATWPDVPWNGLTIAVVVVSAIVPVVFHPIARTLWVAAERHVRLRSGRR